MSHKNKISRHAVTANKAVFYEKLIESITSAEARC